MLEVFGAKRGYPDVGWEQTHVPERPRVIVTTFVTNYSNGLRENNEQTHVPERPRVIVTTFATTFVTNYSNGLRENN
jgi:hypothetical protein